MIATINGIEVEGTKEEIVELIRMFGTMQQAKPWPQLPNPLQPYMQPYIGTPMYPLPGIGTPVRWGDLTCGSGHTDVLYDPNVMMWN